MNLIITTETLKVNDFYQTADLGLAAVLFIFYPLEGIERENPKKAYFVFKRDEHFDGLIEKYWKRELQIEPQAYFGALRAIKARLYGEE